MKKFYQKKDLTVEESPLTLQLQRRHTVVEGDKVKTPVVSKLQQVSRSNSTSSIYRPPKTAKDLSTYKRYLDSRLSSGAPTVVITESQLSSSWLYNNKKAQMFPKEVLSVDESSSNEAPNNENNSRSKGRPVSSQNRHSKRCSSWCCYSTITILAVIALIGILSAIGGIVYMEFFSGSNKTQSLESSQAKSEDMSYEKKIGESPESKQELDFLNRFKDSLDDDIENKQAKNRGNILRVKKDKKDISPTTEADISILIHRTDDLKEDPDKQQNFRQASVPPVVKNESPYSKLFELYKDIHSAISKEINSFEDPVEIDELNTSIDLKEDISDSFEKKIPENTNQDGNKHLHSLDTTFDSKDSAKDSSKEEQDLTSDASSAKIEDLSRPEIPKYFFRLPSKDSGLATRSMFGFSEETDENSEVLPFVQVLPKVLNLDDSKNASRVQSVNNKDSVDSDIDSELHESPIPSGEISGPAIPKNFFQLPTKDSSSSFRDIFDIIKETDAGLSEEQPQSRFLPHIPELSDQDGVDDNIVRNLDVNNKDLNRPVSVAKIAVPGPLDLMRRFAIGGESNDESSESEKHDRRLFFAEALERLRSLDISNILPSSRQKSNSKKNPKEKSEPKVQSEQEVFTERSGYLQKLRRHFFEP